MKKLEVGVGPMSVEIIDAVIKYARHKNIQLMLIASRNQIECAELGGGYVGAFNTRTFAQYVRERDPDGHVMLCRDHCGPFLNDIEKGMSYKEAMERTKQSLSTDMYAMDLIHIDTSAAPDPYAAAEELFSLSMLSSKWLEYEFGTEENIGTAVSVEKFESDVRFITSLYPGVLMPRYVVGQTGSLVKSHQQVGSFSPEVVKQLVSIAEKYGVKLKEHNADYISDAEVQHRKTIGVHAINVAPEFGAAQTQVLVDLAMRCGFVDGLNAFTDHVAASGKWKKWEYGPAFSTYDKLICAGHYHFTDPEYLSLVEKINDHEDFQEHVERRVFQLLDRYTV